MELTEEELTRLAKTSATEKAKVSDFKDNTDVIRFIQEYGIKQGEHPVPVYKIFYDYRKLWRAWDRGKTSKIGFFRVFSRIFKSTRTGNTRYYLLDKEVFDTSKEALDEAKKYDRFYTGAKRAKNKQKKQSEVPSPTEEIQSQG